MASAAIAVIVTAAFGIPHPAAAGILANCEAQNRELPAQLGMPIDVSAVCRCQASLLREQKVDPDGLDERLMAGLQSLGEQTASALPGTKFSEEMQAGINAETGMLFKALSDSFRACVQPEIARHILRPFKKFLGEQS